MNRELKQKLKAAIHNEQMNLDPSDDKRHREYKSAVTPPHVKRRQQERRKARERKYQRKRYASKKARLKKGRRLWMRMIEYLNKQRIARERQERDERKVCLEKIKADREAARIATDPKLARHAKNRDVVYAEGYAAGFAAGREFAAGTSQLS